MISEKHLSHNDKHPTFAVVGHPNKGKSSIVSALSLDSSIMISDTPGTTHKYRSFPMKVENRVLYELFDTPGFQRPRRVLSWLKLHDDGVANRHKVLKSFVVNHKNDTKYNDEIELLTPILDGAAIIYVVDASKPYSQEYEAEMEILQWTGEPSMALINLIGDSDYTQEWKAVLNQYFKMIRTFNPMRTDLSQHIKIFESMAQLKEEWIVPIKESMTLFEEHHKKKIKSSASLASKLVFDALCTVEKYSFSAEELSEDEKSKFQENYKSTLRALEVAMHSKLEKIWYHHNIEKHKDVLYIDEMDLFSSQSISIFGLTKKEIMITGVTSGAVTGAGVDLLLAGHTLLLGGLVGAVVGATGTYLSFDELYKSKVFGKKLGEKYIEIGPMKNINFPYVLLGRAIYHTVELAKRSHASRSKLELQQDGLKQVWLNDKLRKSLEAYHKIFRSNKEVKRETLDKYEDIVQKIILEQISIPLKS